ncbi:MAG TPA: MFS transporter [Candidatus Binatia bacterium]|nr:MFS transporter [Candidatus Binatia bacterium]
MRELVEHPQFAVPLPGKVAIQSWLVVAGCFTGVLMGPALVGSIFSVFFAALLESVPWSRAGIAFAYSLYIMMYGLSGPVVGRWCETFGPKRVFLGGAVLIALGGILLSLVQEGWQFCILYGALGISAGMTGAVPVTVLISRWFVDNRGLAFGVATSGTAGALVFSPLAHSLIAQLGWRQAYLLLGVCAGFILFGTVLATVRDAPGGTTPSKKTEDQPPAVEEGARLQTTEGFTVREALSTQAFWLLTGSGFLFLGVVAGMFAHVVPLALDRGLAKGLAALSLGVIVGMGPVGKVGMGYLADRFEATTVLLGTFLLQGLALLLVVWGGGAVVFWTFVILFSIGQGGALTLAPLVLGHVFGSSALGSLMGTYWLIATAGSLVGPPLAGAVRDATGTYFLVLVLFAAALFCAALLVGLMRNMRLAVP